MPKEIKNEFLIISCIILFSFTQNFEEKLHGKWQLRQIEIAGQFITPSKAKYFIEFSPGNLKYNLAINHCLCNDLKIDSKNISCRDITTSLICCNQREDSLSKFIDYRGSYEIKDSLLVITNVKGIFYLSKTKEN